MKPARKQSRGSKRLKKLLVVDDSVAVRSSLIAYCGELRGIEVVAQAEDGEQAIVAFTVHNPDLVTLDMQMPRIGGMEVLRVIKNRKPECCVLVLTAAPRDMISRQCRELGADFLFDKNTQLEVALRTLSRLARA